MKSIKYLTTLILMTATILSCGHNNQNQPSQKTQSSVKSISNVNAQKYLAAAYKDGGWDVNEYDSTSNHLRKVNKYPLSDGDLSKALRVNSHWVHTINFFFLANTPFVPGAIGFMEEESILTLGQQFVGSWFITPWITEMIHRSARTEAIKGSRTILFSPKKYDIISKRIADPSYNPYL